MAEQKIPENGLFAWNELETTDTAACKTFYAELLGWEAEEMPMGEETYTIFKKDGKQVAGMMRILPEWGEIPSHWLGYVAVENVDALSERVPEIGGRVIVQPTDVPGIGRFAILSDPSGAVVSIMTFVSQ